MTDIVVDGVRTRLSCNLCRHEVQTYELSGDAPARARCSIVEDVDR